MSDSHVTGVDGGNSSSQKNGRDDKMNNHEIGYSFEQHGGLDRSDKLLNGPDEALNFKDMFPFGCTVQVYA